MFFLLVAVAGVAIFFGAVISKAARPYLISYGESREIAQVKKEIAEAQAENNTLKRDINYLSTLKGKEAEARKLGWVKEGEVALVVQQPEDAESKEIEQAKQQAKEPIWRTAGRRILELFARPEPQH